MDNRNSTGEQSVNEAVALRRRIAELEGQITELKLSATEPRRAEEEIEKNKEWLAAIFNASRDGILVEESEIIIYINSSYAHLCGYDNPEELIGNSISMIVFPEDKERMLQFGRRRLRGEPTPDLYEFKGRRRDGTFIELEASVSTVSIGGKTHIITVARDITDRKEVERKLLESENRLQTIINTEPECVKIVSSDGILLDMNPAGLAMIEASSLEEVVGRSIYSLIAQDYRDAYQELTEKVCRGSEGILEFEMIGLKGGRRWLETHAIPIHNREKEVIGALGITRDITERKQAEEQIKISLKEKELLLKEIHHRVKNNLQIVSSLLNLQSRYIQDKESLEIFKESQDRIRTMALIHEKLYQSKDLSKINFGEYIQNLIINLSRSYNINPDKIKFNLTVDEIGLGVDKAIPCALIINELVANSLKYAFPSGRKGNINIGFQSDSENSLMLTVFDNGIGLPQGLDFRNTPTLGLQLVNTLVDQLQGKIEINRTGGTGFNITFEA